MSKVVVLLFLTLLSLSSAMNLYYQSHGRNHWNCDFKGSGIVVVSDPSYGGCIYP
ncbi:hypothetical protein TanjilG_32284 [Lupinus angustifolius]|uniref:X8 domain-containing protein n=1 Tax=Lupinus angustifolius TaxID=3871 RepID=A0A4P1R0K5_LUPAN|nr:hypothetical protein TanjilG_32284 [Lupinus angustifolius]